MPKIRPKLETSGRSRIKTSKRGPGPKGVQQARETKMRVQSVEDAQERYGIIQDGKWADEDTWCVLVELSSEISGGWINSLTGQPTRHIYCNKDIAPVLLQALQNVRDRGLVSELKTFDGCFRACPSLS